MNLMFRILFQGTTTIYLKIWGKKKNFANALGFSCVAKPEPLGPFAMQQDLIFICLAKPS